MSLTSSTRPLDQCKSYDDAAKYPGCLTKHQLKHQDENTQDKKLHQCTLCDYRTVRRGDLMKHSRIHTGDKPFACQSCEYSTSDSSTLTRHLRLHIGGKPFKCDDCDFCTIHKRALKAHSLIHGGKKPFTCSRCEYATSRPWSLTRHMKIHTPKKSVSNIKGTPLTVLERTTTQFSIEGIVGL